MLSIATGLWDWHFAYAEGRLAQNEQASPYVARIARGLLDEAVLIAGRLGRGEVEALQRLLFLMSMEVQLCNLIGHSRPEEGSEHYFAYSIENALGHGFPHAELVGPGIVAMAAAQGQDHRPLQEALDQAGVPLESIPKVAAEATLRGLPAYAARHDLPFGLAHVLNEGQAKQALAAAW